MCSQGPSSTGPTRFRVARPSRSRACGSTPGSSGCSIRASASSRSSWGRRGSTLCPELLATLPLALRRGASCIHLLLQLVQLFGWWVNGSETRFRAVSPGGCRFAPGDCRATPGGCRFAPSDCRATPGGCRFAPGDCRTTPGGCRFAPGDCAGSPPVAADSPPVTAGSPLVAPGDCKRGDATTKRADGAAGYRAMLQPSGAMRQPSGAMRQPSGAMRQPSGAIAKRGDGAAG